MMSAGPPFSITCTRCQSELTPSVEGPAAAMALGWSRFEQLGEDGETAYFITVCPDCLTEVEESGVWPLPGGNEPSG
jgi:hypothetical protein